MKSAIYVYDTRTQFEQPVFTVYDASHVELFLKTLYGEKRPDYIMEFRVRLHPYDPKDPFKQLGSRGMTSQRRK